ncbi:hypothetical protein QTP70_012060 [Hemibagrus guttatus]|uniref:Reverse transcriptase domain-containing protein n=1 Tax=Hemibagrus guttatus TaxID=175788 RepID=A0AAE0V218_9TELE|nr:hypothetical protein QTP70_012060 [Hemibagrus guttatus]
MAVVVNPGLDRSALQKSFSSHFKKLKFREFSAVFLLAVYIPPEADHVTALGILHNVISRQETAHPDAVIVAAYKQLLKRAPTVSKTMLCACSTAFVTEDIGEYKKARYNLCKSIRKAERDYSLRLEGYYTTADSRCMWHITEYRQRKGILDMPLALSSAEVRMALRKTNPRKAASPDNIPGWALMVCSLELADMFTDIYNLSLAQALVPTCFKSTTIIPLPKKNTVTCLNDYRPFALTPIAMKCLERIVMSHIKRNIPTTLDQFQFAYRQNRSTEDGVNTAIHTALTHLEGKDTYVRMLFIDYSSAFNTVIPHRLSE